MYHYFDFKEFDFTDGIINIPENTLFFRGIQDEKNIKNLTILRPEKPIYLTSKEVAHTKYKSEKLYCIKNTKILKLMDIRKIMYLLLMMIDSYNADFRDSEYRNSVIILTISLGLCELPTQIHLLDNFLKVNNVNDVNILNGYSRLVKYLEAYKLNKQDILGMSGGLYWKKGVRIGLTDIDIEMTILLKELFSDYCDGYIAPQLFSPIQNNFFMHEEIVIFDAPKCLNVINEPNKQDIMFNHISFLFTLHYKSFTFKYHANNYLKFKSNMIGGHIFEIEDRNMYCKNIKKFVKSAKKFARKFVKKIPHDQEQDNNPREVQLTPLDLDKKHLTYNFEIKKSEHFGWRNAFLKD
jgi:hypothetical protein